MDYSFAQLLFGKPCVGDEKLIREYSDTVERKQEIACLFPLPITIMPHCEIAEDETVYEHFNDALKAHFTYVKTNKIVFDMRNYIYQGFSKESSMYKGVSGVYEYIRMIQTRLKEHICGVECVILLPALMDIHENNINGIRWSFDQYDKHPYIFANSFVDESYLFKNGFAIGKKD